MPGQKNPLSEILQVLKKSSIKNWEVSPSEWKNAYLIEMISEETWVWARVYDNKIIIRYVYFMKEAKATSEYKIPAKDPQFLRFKNLLDTMKALLVQSVSSYIKEKKILNMED